VTQISNNRELAKKKKKKKNGGRVKPWIQAEE
jgi:hypothetical protein